MATTGSTQPAAAGPVIGGSATHAAEQAAERAGIRVRVPFVGGVTLPPAEQLAYLAGVGVLAALDLVDWPVAMVLALGHELAASRNHRLLHDFGEALEEA